MSTKHQKALAKVQQLNLIITNNPHVFTEGKVFPESTFCTLAGIPQQTTFKTSKDASRYLLSKVKELGSINKLLALRGMYIRSKDYGQFYAVLPKTKLPSRINAYKKQAAAKEHAGRTLAKGFDTYEAVWSALDDFEVAEVANRLMCVLPFTPPLYSTKSGKY
jgi:hypothetical protein